MFQLLHHVKRSNKVYCLFWHCCGLCAVVWASLAVSSACRGASLTPTTATKAFATPCILDINVGYRTFTFADLLQT
jgi:hypothetical protein